MIHEREKVIEGLEKAKIVIEAWVPMFEQYNSQFAIDCTIELLKEQEAVEPTLIREGRNKNYNYYVCPRCDDEVVYEQNYCSECGVQFLWEGR